jgi:O-antigen/teichoic acid export membrane protein
VAAVGAITLAGTITLYTTRMDDVLSHSLYATICAAKDRVDLLFESFSKTNRMALLWATPVGIGLALFAHPLVHFVLGDRWRAAIIVIQVMAINAVINQIGFNWASFYRALGNTRPTAVASVAVLVGTLSLAIPLLLIDGLRGYAIGMGLATLIYAGIRIFYLKQLFPGLRMLPHVARAFAPTAPAVVAVLLVRATGAPFTAGWELAELVTFGALVVGATAIGERVLLREFIGYLRRPASPVPA